MDAGLDAVLESVPRAHDVHVLFVELEPVAFAALVDHLIHTRDNFSLADWATLVRAGIEISVESSARAENADGCLANVHNQPASFRYLFPRTNKNFLCCGWHFFLDDARLLMRDARNRCTYAASGV